jgi:ankyrin only family protein
MLSINRDSGLEITDQLEGLHLSTDSYGKDPSKIHEIGNRDSGFDAEDQVDSCYSPCKLKDSKCEEPSQFEDPAYYSVPETELVHALFEQDDDGDNNLHMAIIHRNVTMAEAIVDMCPSADLLNLQNDFRQTALHLAVLTNLPPLTRRLVVKGARLETRDRNGNTALHLACKHGFEACVEMLTTPLSQEERKSVPYDLPPRSIPQDLTINNYEGEPCLHVCLKAPAVHRIRLICYLIQRCGANVNIMEGKGGRTLLHEAASCNDAQLAEFLLHQVNIQVDSRTYGGHTPLILAKSGCHEDIACKLMVRGADPYALFEVESDTESEDSMDSAVFG